MKRKKLHKRVFTLIMTMAILLVVLPTTVHGVVGQQDPPENIAESDMTEFPQTVTGEPVISEESDEKIDQNSTEELQTDLLNENIHYSEEHDTVGASTMAQTIQIGDQIEAIGDIGIESGMKIATLTISGIGSTYNYNSDSSKNPLYTYIQKEHPQTVRLIVLDGVTTLGDYLFYNITELETFQFSETVDSIGNFSFANTGITELSLPDTLKKAGTSAFHNCEKLKKVVTTGGLSYIPHDTFSSCSQLEEVYFSETCAEKIGMNCFDSCKKLKAVHIPPNVHFIYEDWDYLDNIFGRYTNASIYGMTNTFAESYANRWGFKFISEGNYETEKVLLDEIRFPDPYLRANLESYDYNDDDYLDIYQLQDVNSITFFDNRIQDFTGIEYFTRLNTIKLGSNNKNPKMHITKLDLSQNKELSWVEITNCLLESLDFGDTPFIKSVDLINSDVTDRNLQPLSNITSLLLENMSWDYVDMSPLKAVNSVNIIGNNITELDVSSCEELEYLSILDVPLTKLTIGDGKKLKSLRLSATELPFLKLGNKAALNQILIVGSSIKELDISKCPSLKRVALYFTDCTRDNIKLNKNQKNLDMKMAAKKYSLYVGSSLLIPIDKLDNFKDGFLDDDDTYFNNCFADLGELKPVINSQRQTTALKVPTFKGSKKTFKIYICSSLCGPEGTNKIVYELPITVQKAQADVRKPKLKTLTISNHYNIRLTWNKVSDVNGYIVYRKKDNGKWTRIKTLNSKYTTFNDTSHKVSGLTYTYTVKAFKTVKGEEVTSAYDKNGLSAVPGVPDKIIITTAKAGKSKATLTWKKDGAAYGYRIYRAVKKDGKYEKVATLKRRSFTTFTDTELKSGKTYYYKVRGYNNLGRFCWGKYSAIQTIKIK